MSIDHLPPDLAAIRDRLAAFLKDELLPAERERGVYEEGDAPADLRRWVRTRSQKLGLFRLTQPKDVGGDAIGPLGQVALRETIAASGAVLGRYVLGGGGGMLRNGTFDQQQRFLAPVLRGELSAAFAFTDAREGPRTTAVRRGDQFLVTGVKSFVTGGPHADLLLTVANVTENADGPTGTAVLIVGRETPGVTMRRELRTLDGGVHGEFEFREAAVPATDVLGEIGKGLPRALENITGMRLTVAATACGTARWALDYTLAQVDQPHRTGTPLADREQVQAMIADSATDLFAARAALYAAARLAESGADADVEVAMAKSLATEAVTRIVDRAIQLTGGGAVVEGHPLARLYRLIRGWRIAEGTTEILRLTIARGLLARRRSTSP
ncbi:MAG: acyl-CoA/acyl-ACP dehydrogenase [Chloroflexi bacterium]|nr:acyl-CoA/acyl-ACP dehydrogenase [Chloroflexota bacterium]